MAGRPTVPFLPIHLKDILFALEGCKPSLADKHHIAYDVMQIIAKCVTGVVLRKKFEEFKPNAQLLEYIEVSDNLDRSHVYICDVDFIHIEARMLACLAAVLPPSLNAIFLILPSPPPPSLPISAPRFRNLP